MQILYVTGILAVFVLCLALLSTARRILRSPLAGGQLGLAHIEMPGLVMPDLDQDSPLEPIAHNLPMARVETEYVSSSSVVDDTLWGDAEDPAQAVSADNAPHEEPIQVGPIAVVSEPFSAEPGSEDHETRKPARRAYNYALECLLLGVSALVLIKTQRDTFRYRTAHPSSDRVA